ncbi:MAG TPA: efflux RND transporter permease subunit, partial [Gemmataceae bacterium]|nr:efflux RND transporter permease subunit [Gemmataceae bacterium]
LKKLLPKDVQVKTLFDQSVFVRASLNGVLREGTIAAGLTALMILLFLGNWRMTVIASTSIPLAVLGSIIGLYVTGNTINAMTLGGLALAVGPLVDDAIVALENIHRHGSMGKSRLRAALDGSIEVMVPVMIATCTTMIVLAPLALVPGMGGFLFKPLALAVAFAMITSFVLSRTYVPMMCYKFLGADHPHHHPDHGEDRVGLFAGFHRRFERFLDGVTRGYSAALGWALRRRFLVLGAVLLLFLASLGLAFGIGREFFPAVDAGQITMYVRTPSNLRLDAAEARIAAVEKLIDTVIPADERKENGLVSEIGLDPDWSAAYTANSGQQDAVIRIQLNEKRRYSSQEYANRLRDAITEDSEHRFDDLRVRFDTGGMVSTALNEGASSPIDVQIQFSSSGGKKAAPPQEKPASWWSWLPWHQPPPPPPPPEPQTPQTLSDVLAEQFSAPGRKTDPKEVRLHVLQLAEEIRSEIATVPGAADVQVRQRLDAPYLVIKVDRQKAAAAGLSAQEVILQVVAAMNSSVSINRNFWIDTRSGNQYFVAVQYPENPSVNVQDLLNIFATGTSQPHSVKLSSLATPVPDTDAVEITHENLYPTFDVMVNTRNRDVAGVAGDVIAKLRVLQQRKWTEDARPSGGAPSIVPADDAEGGIQFPNGVSIHLKGEYGRMNESFSNLLMGLAGAAVLVYLLQVALFRSWVGPFIIMFTVPLGLIGVLTMLYVTGTTLNVQSEMGVIFLVGIAVNNGVLLVDFANKQRMQGATARNAVATAAAIRLRPILMTFLATFLDLIPMGFPSLFGVHGGESNVPLARAVVGGLLTSTCLTLFVVPILYSLLMRDGADPEVDIDAEASDEPVGAAPAALPTPAVARHGAASEAISDHVTDGIPAEQEE